jgi:hypothetical protein
MSTKNDNIVKAYDQLRISGLTLLPSPSDEALALYTLEDMAAEWFSSRNLNIDYNFETTPNLNSETGVERGLESMLYYNLATRLEIPFNKQVPQRLTMLAGSSFSSALGAAQAKKVRQVQYPRRMPRGSGQTYRNMYYNRYHVPEGLPEISAANNQILVGETQEYFESFDAWLGSNTIASFTITVDPRFTLVTSANADPRITYTLTATDAEGEGVWQLVKITVTDSAGRVEIRLVNFLVCDPPEVP